MSRTKRRGGKGANKPRQVLPKKPPLTHFLCLPLVTPSSKPQLEASLANFRDAVAPNDPTTAQEAEEAAENTEEKTLPNVHPRAIRPEGALHCTLGVMSLKPDALQSAVELLDGIDVRDLLSGDPPVISSTIPPQDVEQGGSEVPSLKRPITPPQTARPVDPLTVNLKGLESMHAPQKTSILYIAPSDSSGRLFDFCLKLQQKFKDKGLLVEDDRELKLHATIVNTIYAKGQKRGWGKRAMKTELNSGGPSNSAAPGEDRSTGHGPNANASLTIDASQILERYRDYVWAENVVLDRVAICEMGAKEIRDDQDNVKGEGYKEVASIPLPT